MNFEYHIVTHFRQCFVAWQQFTAYDIDQLKYM
jgi:hypothetical protein